MNIKDLKPNMRGRFKQGYFLPKNPAKYYGDPTKIIYRSSYEKRFMEWVDLHPKVTRWGSEVVAIPYLHPIKKRINNYNIDFFVEVIGAINESGQQQLIKYLVEVKPESQTTPPNRKLVEAKATLNRMKRYNRELETYLVNVAKFSAADAYAKGRGMKFIICTEKFLF